MSAVNSALHANPARSWTRLDGVDLLRGMAIFFVLMNHVNMRLMSAKVPYTAALPRELVSSLIWNAQYGVQIFFAVSGFLITSTAMRRWGSSSAQSAYAIFMSFVSRASRRCFFRLLAVLSVLHAARVGDFVVPASAGGLGRALFAALTFHVNVLEARRGISAWQLGRAVVSVGRGDVLSVFSVGLCCCCARGRGVRSLRCYAHWFRCLGPFARTVLSHGNPIWRNYSYLGGMDAIAMGCLTAILFVAGARASGLACPALLMVRGLGVASLAFVLCHRCGCMPWAIPGTAWT